MGQEPRQHGAVLRTLLRPASGCGAGGGMLSRYQPRWSCAPPPTSPLPLSPAPSRAFSISQTRRSSSDFSGKAQAHKHPQLPARHPPRCPQTGSHPQGRAPRGRPLPAPLSSPSPKPNKPQHPIVLLQSLHAAAPHDPAHGGQASTACSPQGPHPPGCTSPSERASISAFRPPHSWPS